ncbi:MAG: D-amino acid dehydrogenase [Glaciimonas sp.]|nr:D-amino acid dehydrogenase [Glaciimonas sp.]
MVQKQIAVIGGGVIGVSTAYFLAAAGHQVVVIERRGNVAEEASFGDAGVMAPGYVTPWARPGMPKHLLAYLFKQETPLMLPRKMDPALWRWIRLWLSECELENFRTNMHRMQRLIAYSSDTLLQMERQLQLQDLPIDKKTQGYLQLFRTAQDVALAEPALAILAELDSAHRLLDTDAVRQLEPALASQTALAGGLYLPHSTTANCSLFTKQLKQIAMSMGVEFIFGSSVSTITQKNNQLALEIGETSFSADAIVLAAGAESARMLKNLGINTPLFSVKSFAATATVKDMDAVPIAALMDETYRVSITRMGNRIRLAGTAELASRSATVPEAARRTLRKIGIDWFPHAANYNNANFWCGLQATLPDGPPLIGATPIRNLFVNIGHGANGWAMAAGAGKLVADIVSEREPEIDLDGLTLARYGVRTFS